MRSAYMAFAVMLGLLVPLAVPVCRCLADDQPEAVQAGAKASGPVFEHTLSVRPTGDVLWDRYASTLIASQVLGALHQMGHQIPNQEIYELYGTALWDTGLEEVLEANPDIDAVLAQSVGSDAPFPPGLPDEILAGWETEFGADPRYWQLRYWNAWQPFLPENEAAVAKEPQHFLKMTVERGINDACIDWLLLEAQWQALEPPDSAAAVEEDYQSRLALLDAFIGQHPEQSCGWYRRARLQQNYGEWESALADIQQGNAAELNSMLLPFPLSYVAQRAIGADWRIKPDPACGAVVAKAMGISGERTTDLFNSNKEFLVVLRLAGDSALMQDLLTYASRLGAMEGANVHQQLAACNLAASLAHELLVGHPGSSVEQRDATMHLYDTARALANRSDRANPSPRGESIHSRVAQRMQLEGVSYGMAITYSLPDWLPEPYSPEFMAQTMDGHYPALVGLTVQRDLYYPTTVMVRLYYLLELGEWLWEDSRDAASAVSFERLARFDVETLSWPEGDIDWIDP